MKSKLTEEFGMDFDIKERKLTDGSSVFSVIMSTSYNTIELHATSYENASELMEMLQRKCLDFDVLK
jgi:hypothetical protein